ncbi:hypothetical protein SAMN05444395_107159 [Flavobacterium fryxellicola]|nr:hypothetical protein SAMN05444395_107159 [Flavobacterium fryxellicola]
MEVFLNRILKNFGFDYSGNFVILNEYLAQDSKKNPARVSSCRIIFYWMGSKLIAVPPPGAKFSLILDLLVTTVVLI